MALGYVRLRRTRYDEAVPYLEQASHLAGPQAATLSWVPGLAKYIPGKVVAIGGTVYLLRRYKISGVPVTEGKKLVGILTNRDLRFETRTDVPVRQVMTSKNLITVAVGRVGATRASANNFLIPPVALLLGVTLRGEHVPALAVAGATVAVTGAWLMQRARLGAPAPVLAGSRQAS